MPMSLRAEPKGLLSFLYSSTLAGWKFQQTLHGILKNLKHVTVARDPRIFFREFYSRNFYTKTQPFSGFLYGYIIKLVSHKTLRMQEREKG